MRNLLIILTCTLFLVFHFSCTNPSICQGCANTYPPEKTYADSEIIPPRFADFLNKNKIKVGVDSIGGAYIPNEYVGMILNKDLALLDVNDPNSKQQVLDTFFKKIQRFYPDSFIIDKFRGRIDTSNIELCPCSAQAFKISTDMIIDTDILEGRDDNGTAENTDPGIEEFGIDRNYLSFNELQDTCSDQGIQLMSGQLPHSTLASLKNMADSRQDPIDVAILDTGLDYSQWINSPNTNMDKVQFPLWADSLKCGIDKIGIGWDFVNNDPWPLDDHSHGTHVAGIIYNKYLQFIGNGDRKPEMSKLNIMPLKTHNEKGVGTLFNIACALLFAHEHEADVVNMSFGYYGWESEVIESLVSQMTKDSADGAFVSASMGNDGYFVGLDEADEFCRETPADPSIAREDSLKCAFYLDTAYSHYPSDLAKVRLFNVGAVESDSTDWVHSNIDSIVQHMAPGVHILSYYPVYLIRTEDGISCTYSGKVIQELHNFPAIEKSGSSMSAAYVSALSAAYRHQSSSTTNMRRDIVGYCGLPLFNYPRTHVQIIFGPTLKLIHPLDK